MKAISLWQPYASLVGIKEIETRSRYTKYRGPLAIHAAKKFPKEAKELCYQEPFFTTLTEAGLFYPYTAMMGISITDNCPYDFPFGAIVSTCNLVECCLIKTDGLYKVPDGQPVRGPASFTEFYAPLPSEPERSFGDYAPGRFAWILRDIKPLPEPIPAVGHQRLWNWEPPKGVFING